MKKKLLQLNNNLFYGNYKIHSVEREEHSNYWYDESANEFVPNPNKGKEYFVVKSDLGTFNCDEDNEHFEKIKLLYYQMALQNTINIIINITNCKTKDIIDFILESKL